MIICRICSAECEEDMEFCPVCGAELVVEQPEEEPGYVEVELNNPVLAASVEDVITSEIYRDALITAGIPFTVDGGIDEGGMQLLFGGGFQSEDIYVDVENLEQAEEIYNDVLDSLEDSTEYDDNRDYSFADDNYELTDIENEQEDWDEPPAEEESHGDDMADFLLFNSDNFDI